MAAKNAGGKVRKYRIIFKNTSPNDSDVRGIVEVELGNVRVTSWYIEESVHFQGLVSGGGMMPQRHTYVMVRYKEIPKRRSK